MSRTVNPGFDRPDTRNRRCAPLTPVVETPAVGTVVPEISKSVFVIFQDEKVVYWFGTETLGVCRYDGRSFRWLYEDHLTNPATGGSFGIRSVLEDRRGRFWFSSTKYRYAISPNGASGNAPLEYRTEIGIPDVGSREANDRLYCLSMGEEDERNMWMVTYRDGVWRYDGKRMIQYKVKEGAKEVTLFSVYKDKRGDLWLGTHEAGAYRFNGKTFEKFTPAAPPE